MDQEEATLGYQRSETVQLLRNSRPTNPLV